MSDDRLKTAYEAVKNAYENAEMESFGRHQLKIALDNLDIYMEGKQ